MGRAKQPRDRSSVSFAGFQASSDAASRAKQANSATDTVHERTLRSWLWRLGLRYRKNVPWLPGKPDIVFTAAKTVVFCDGDFWHGRNWKILRQKLAGGANARYWASKIETNINRDAVVNAKLRASGWRVVRLWETDILCHPERSARQVAAVVHRRLQGGGRAR